MFIKKFQDCTEFIAGDDTILREIISPLNDNADLKIRYSLAHAILKPNKKSYPHKLKTSEVYYILEGEGIMHIDDEAARVSAGDTIYIPPNSSQHIENSGAVDLKFLCIVDPAWRKEDEEVLGLTNIHNI